MCLHQNTCRREWVHSLVRFNHDALGSVCPQFNSCRGQRHVTYTFCVFLLEGCVVRRVSTSFVFSEDVYTLNCECTDPIKEVNPRLCRLSSRVRISDSRWIPFVLYDTTRIPTGDALICYTAIIGAALRGVVSTVQQSLKNTCTGLLSIPFSAQRLFGQLHCRQIRTGFPAMFLAPKGVTTWFLHRTCTFACVCLPWHYSCVFRLREGL